MLFSIAWLAAAAPALGSGSEAEWKGWLSNFGHDNYVFPEWIREQMLACECSVAGGLAGDVTCRDTREGSPAQQGTSFCEAKEWLLNRMPEFDRSFLPPSVSVEGRSMCDDNVAFWLMAENATLFGDRIPSQVKLGYTLPYANFHEARTNWRPLLFAKFFSLVAGARSTREAMALLAAPNRFTNWTGYMWDDAPAAGGPNPNYAVQWGSSTSPPVTSPVDFVAYGYGSCTAWATLLTYVARAVGVPARQVGTPCWNSGEFAGLAESNPNVTKCWHGGVGRSRGGKWLNNHNWVEFWDDQAGEWAFINVPPGSSSPDSGLCGDDFKPETGCGWSNETGCSQVNGGPGAAGRDHEIFSVTWLLEDEFDVGVNGGGFVDSAKLKLTSGEEVGPLVWSPYLSSPLGKPLGRMGLRLVNRSNFYRCKSAATA